MNKYAKYYDDVEKKSNNCEQELIDDLMIDFYTLNSFVEFSDFSNYELLHYILENFYMFNKKSQQYILNNLLNKLNNERLINLYLILICESKTKKDSKKLNNLVKSFNITNLIKNIIYNQDKDIFILTTTTGRKIKFKEMFKDYSEVNISNKNCHNITQKILFENKKDSNIYGVTVLNKNFANKNEYHSFILCNNIVNDYAHNIIISLDDYKILYNPKIILSINATQLIQNAEKLAQVDIEFKNDDSPYILKYAMHKQMKKDKKRKKTN